MKVGSGVRFDAQGFPVAEEDDPVIQAAKKAAKASKQARLAAVGLVVPWVVVVGRGDNVLQPPPAPPPGPHPMFSADTEPHAPGNEL